MPLCCKLQVFIIDNIISVKLWSCLVTWHQHCNPLGHPGADHVTHICPAKIVEDFYTNSCLPASFLPVLTEPFYPVCSMFIEKDRWQEFPAFFSMTTDGLKCFFSSSSRYLILASAFFYSPTSSRTITSWRPTWLRAKLAISEIRHPDRFAKTIKSLMYSGFDSLKAMNSQLDWKQG